MTPALMAHADASATPPKSPSRPKGKAGPQTFPSSVGPEASEEVAADEPFTLPIISTGTPTPSTAFGGWAMRRRQ